METVSPSTLKIQLAKISMFWVTTNISVGSPPSEDADKTDWVSIYNKPVIMSEFGGDALFGLHGSPTARWTEEYQENLYQHQIGMLKRISFLRGTTPWILKDFRSPRRTLPRIQDFFNRKGLVSERGEKKKAFFVLQKFYRDMQNAQTAGVK